MLNSRLDKWMARRRELAREEGGAVLLMCLAAVLVLLLVCWLLFDAIMVSKEKIDTQASADVAAFSQAGVKARAMNMMAFTNVGKRSIVGVHSVYGSMMQAYYDWVMARVMECVAGLPQCNYEVAEANRDLFLEELESDFETFEGNQDYYVADVRALDNYQNYVFAMSPWWGWSEAVSRAQRNGATLATSFPPPQGLPRTGFPNLMPEILAEAGPVGFNVLSDVERLPIRRGDFLQSMVQRGMIDNELWTGSQHAENVQVHRERSELGAAYPEVISRGASFGSTGTMSRGLAQTAAAMRIPGTEMSYAAPWEMQRFDNEARWLRATSNIILTFHADPYQFEQKREKYRLLEDYTIPAETEQIYRPHGFWGMARSEISFQVDEAPHLWSPSWTARMRPVALPMEFREAGYDFNALYHASMTRLLLSGMMHEDLVGNGDAFLRDFIYMERISRSLGQSTIDGVGR